MAKKQESSAPETQALETGDTGVVMRSTGSYYQVRRESDGQMLTCSLRGKLRLKDYDTTNPIAVGDYVRVSHAEDRGLIEEILPRENHILRRSTHRAHEKQILCANIDQAAIIFSIEYPFTPLSYVDRFLVMCEAYHIPAVIIINKIDLLTKQKHLNKLADYHMLYEDIGYPAYAISATDPKYREQMQEVFRGKTTFLGGKSGAGKSALANLIDPELNLRTSAISKSSGKGKHTTTFAQMHPLSAGGYLIDAPGFKEFEVVDLSPEELSHYYPEMRDRLQECKFNNCTHTEEPECAVKEAVMEGEISETRFNTYLNILETLEAEQK